MTKYQKNRKNFRKKLNQKANFFQIKCSKCRREYKIHTNNTELYTEEIINNWVCVLCNLKKGGK